MINLRNACNYDYSLSGNVVGTFCFDDAFDYSIIDRTRTLLDIALFYDIALFHDIALCYDIVLFYDIALFYDIDVFFCNAYTFPDRLSLKKELYVKITYV